MNKPAGRIVSGKVVSVKTAKTVIVAVSTTFRHPLYKKAVRRTKRFAAHNESLNIAVGDMIHMQETKPLSKTKHYRVIQKIV